MKVSLTKINPKYEDCCSATIEWSQYWREYESAEYKLENIEEAKKLFLEILAYGFIAAHCNDTVLEAMKESLLDRSNKHSFAWLADIIKKEDPSRAINIAKATLYLYQNNIKYLINFDCYSDLQKSIEQELGQHIQNIKNYEDNLDFISAEDIKNGKKIFDNLFVSIELLIEKEILQQKVQAQSNLEKKFLKI